MPMLLPSALSHAAVSVSACALPRSLPLPTRRHPAKRTTHFSAAAKTSVVACSSCRALSSCWLPAHVGSKLLKSTNSSLGTGVVACSSGLQEQQHHQNTDTDTH
jgi:hypothetical protein